MASVAKGFNYGEYLGLVARRKSPNIESMSPRARKAYLGRQLRMVEAQIGVVIDRLAGGSDESPSGFREKGRDVRLVAAPDGDAR